MKKRVLKEILSWVFVIAAAFLLAAFINKFLIMRVKIPSGSMENTIMIGDSVITNHQAYLFNKPKRGDIVVFKAPDEEDVDFIKRIIGLPGDKVEGKDGVVYVNEEPLTEDYLKEEMDKEDFGPYTVPEDSYFMMGDNRNDSNDSRYWTNKFVKRSKIKGKAICKFPDFTWLN